MSDKPEFDKAEKNTHPPDNRLPGASGGRAPATTGPLLKLAAIVVVGSAAGFLLARDKNAGQPAEISYTGPTTRTLFGLTLAKKTPPRATFSLLSGGKEYREAAYAASVDPEEHSGSRTGATSGLLYSLSGPNPSRLSFNMDVNVQTPSESGAGNTARDNNGTKNDRTAQTATPAYGSKMATAMKASDEKSSARGSAARSSQAQNQQGLSAGGQSRAANSGVHSGATRAQASAATANNSTAASSYQTQAHTAVQANEITVYQQPAGGSNTQSFSGGQASSYQTQNYSPGTPSVMPSAPSGSEDSAFMREMMDFVANRFSAYIPTLAAPVTGNPIGRGMAAAIPRNSGGGGMDSAQFSALQNESRLANGRAAAAEQAASQAYTRMAALSEESKLAAARAATAEQNARLAEEAARRATDAARRAEQNASASAAEKLAAEERARVAEAAAASARQEAQDATAAKLASEESARLAQIAADRAATERDTANATAARLQTDLTAAAANNTQLTAQLATQRTESAAALAAQETLTAEQQALAEQRAAAIAEQETRIAATEAALAAQETKIAAAESALAAQETLTAEQRALAEQQAADLAAQRDQAALLSAQVAEQQAAITDMTAQHQTELATLQSRLAGAQGDTDALRGQLDSIYDAAQASGGVVVSSDATMMPLGTVITQARNECVAQKEAMEAALMSLEDNTAILTNQINSSLKRGGHYMSNMPGYLDSEDRLCNVDNNGIFDNTVASIMTALNQMQSTLQRSQEMSCDMNLFSRSDTGGWECGIISPAKNSILPIVNWINEKCSIYRPKRILENTYNVSAPGILQSASISYRLHADGVTIGGAQASLTNYRDLKSLWDTEGFGAKSGELSTLLDSDNNPTSLWNFKRKLTGEDDADDSLQSRRDRWARMLNSNATCDYDRQDAELAETESRLGTCEEIKTHNEAVCTQFTVNASAQDLAAVTLYSGGDLDYARSVIEDCNNGCLPDVANNLQNARTLVHTKALEGCISTYASSCPTVED